MWRLVLSLGTVGFLGSCGGSSGAASSHDLSLELGAAVRDGDESALEGMSHPGYDGAESDVRSELDQLVDLVLDDMCVVVVDDFPMAHSIWLYADAVGVGSADPWAMRISAYETGGWWAGFGQPERRVKPTR